MTTKAIGVVDVETTGLFPFRHDRIVEVAVVLLHTDGRIGREFVSLVDPGRDIGPSSVHGLTSGDVLRAPQFGEIAGQILEALDGAVALAGHNVRFDRQFLDNEFLRLGCTLPSCLNICTMQLAGGGNLEECCRDFGLLSEGGRHHALADARTAAQLLVHLLGDDPRTVQQIQECAVVRWPQITLARKQPVTREESRRQQAEEPTYLQELLRRRPEPALSDAGDGTVIAYGALLDRALEDRCIDPSEADALIETATQWGLTRSQVEHAHRSYLDHLVVVAVSDGTVTEAERRDLKSVAHLLGQANRDWDRILAEATARLASARQRVAASRATVSNLAGLRVCFTGELQSRHEGIPITRQLAEDLAAKAGMVVMDSVTKACDLLVLADPNSQSGKAKRARQYGTRVMHEAVFWKTIGVRI